MPERLMGFYTEDLAVIKLGSDYLRIVGHELCVHGDHGFLYFCVAQHYTGQADRIVAVLALGLKTILAYLFIFGIAGCPRWVYVAAALGTCIGWSFQAILLVILVYIRKTPLAANPLSFFRFDRPFLLKVLKTSMPAAADEILWSVWDHHL